jgi:hypothetical protein
MRSFEMSTTERPSAPSEPAGRLAGDLVLEPRDARAALPERGTHSPHAQLHRVQLLSQPLDTAPEFLHLAVRLGRASDRPGAGVSAIQAEVLMAILTHTQASKEEPA